MEFILTPISTSPWERHLRTLSQRYRAFYRQRLHEAWRRVGSCTRLPAHTHAPGPGVGARPWARRVGCAAAAVACAEPSVGRVGQLLGTALCASAGTRGRLRQERGP